MESFWFYVIAGFVAQLIDGALGMAYGLSATALLISFGISAPSASATVHTAEVFTTGFSAVSHHYFGNIDRQLFWRLLIPGVVGAGLGAYTLASLAGEHLKPFVAVYLMIMGVIVLVKVFRRFPPVAVKEYVRLLGFVGALLDAMGGGGWGAMVNSTLLARGSHPRMTVGTVNTVEFFVTLTASIVFVATLGLTYGEIILGLAVGGALAAPIGAYACKVVPVKWLMGLVGAMVVLLSGYTLMVSV